MIFRNLLRRRGRTLMTILAVMAATSLLLSMLSIAEGLLAAARRDVESTAADLRVNFQFRFIANGSQLGDDLEEWPEIDRTTVRLNTLTSFVNTTGDLELMFGVGVIPDEEWDFYFDEERSRFGKGEDWFPHGGDPHRSGNYTGPWTNELLLDRTSAQRLGYQRGDEMAVTNITAGTTRNYTIVGLFESPFVNTAASDVTVAYFRLSELQSLVGEDLWPDGTVRDSISSLDISVAAESRDNLSGLTEAIEEAYPELEDHIFTKEDRLTEAEEEVALSRAYYQAIGSVAIFIGLLFVSVIMVMTVRERTPEIGMMRAIGLGRSRIFRVVFAESLLIVFLGSLLGTIPGYLGSVFLGSYLSAGAGLSTPLTAFTPGLVLGSVISITVVGSLFSLLPAWMATRVEVLEAMKKKG